MFAALSENCEFFRTRMNIGIMIAPVTRVDHMTSATLNKLKDNENAISFVKNLGPEIMRSP